MRFQLSILLFLISYSIRGQGFNSQWLLGSYNFFQDPKGRVLFDSGNYSLLNENRKMVFKGTEANISDANGNLLMSSNGVWIANANNDTMLDGSGLNPSAFTSNWPLGFPIGFGNIILPYPGDSSKYVLLHKTLWGTLFPERMGVYKSIIDMNLDGGLGGVSTKNDTILVDTLSWGIGACKHANGRDWWVMVVRDINPVAYTFLITPTGVDTVFTQSLNFAANTNGNVSPIIFSQDGSKMIYCTPVNQTQTGTILLSNFDRCTGILSNTQPIPVSTNEYLFGLAFSPSEQFIYSCSSNYIFQTNISTLLTDTVAIYDGFISPPNLSCCATTFWSLYLAANGKIYVTSGSGVQHLHEINYPDSAGLACNVQQHALNLGYAQLRAVPNHPNYYLGCDTSQTTCPCLTSIRDLSKHAFRFRINPNPVSSGQLSIGYLLPQNQKGLFQIYDVNGKIVFSYNLPQWSNEQNFVLPFLSNGIYNCVITSANQRVSKKIAVIHE